MPLSLSRKILILVTVPVLFELALVGTLCSLITKVEEARERAAHARELGSHLNSLMALCMRRASSILLDSATPGSHRNPHMTEIGEQLNQEIQIIKTLVDKEPTERADWLVVEKSFNAVDTSFTKSKQFLDEDNKMAAAVSWAKARPDVERIFLYCGKLAEAQKKVQGERQAQVEKYDLYLQMALGSSVLLSVVIAFGLAFYFNRGTTNRFNALIRNSKRLSNGLPPIEKLTGGDELARLDTVYQQMFQDLTALRQKERAILDNAADIICSLDQQLMIVEINSAATKNWGYSREELLNRPIIDFIVEEEIEFAVSRFREAETNKSEIRFEAPVLCLDGSVAEASWSATWSEAERSLYCVLADITERKRLERLKQEFVSMISHDLRTPLTSVMMALDMVTTADTNLSPMSHEYLTRAGQNLDFTISLINQLLDIEKMQSGAITLALDAVSTKAILTRVLNAVADLAQAKKLTITIPEVNIELIADRERIMQVAINLLGNAIKFSPPGGKIAVETEELADCVRISVVDNGPGIPEHEQERIFERFQQIEYNQSGVPHGTGLGLAICKAIAIAHGGKVGVTSCLGKGSRFWIEIPLEPNNNS